MNSKETTHRLYSGAVGLSPCADLRGPVIITCQFIQLILCIVKEIKGIFVTMKSVCYVELYILTNQALPMCLNANYWSVVSRSM